MPALLGAAARGALVGAAAGAASGVLGPEAGLGVWGAMGGGALGGAAGNLAGQAFDNATGRQHGLNRKSLARDTLLGAAFGLVLHYANPFLQKVFCFDGDTPVQIAPKAAQVALATAAAVTAHNSGKGDGKDGKSARPASSLSLGLPASSTKKIKDMKPGDVVLSRNARTGQVEYKKVLGVSRSISPRLLAVSVADKKTGKVVEVIKATPEHPFFTTKGLVAAGDLGIGTELVTRAGPSSKASGSGLVVKAVTPVAATFGKDGKRAGFVVYNLEVEDDHTYFVGNANGGAWVHNACNWRVHGVAPDWAVKGAHVTVDGIELAVRPGVGGSIGFTPVFSGGNDAATQAAITNANQLLENSRFTNTLLERVQAAKSYVLQYPNDGGTGRSAEFHFLEAALKRLQGQ